MKLTFVKDEGDAYRVKETGDLCSLPLISKVVTIENYSSGTRHSAHPNINSTGSVRVMKKLGYWAKTDITTSQRGTIYNISKVYCSNPLDHLCFAIERHDCKTTFTGEDTIIYEFAE